MSGRDPGLQAERTALAWQRTAVAVLLLSVAVSWRAAAERSRLLLGFTVASAVWAAAATVVVPRSVQGLDGRHPVRPFGRLRVVVLATVLLALTGAATALVSAGAHP